DYRPFLSLALDPLKRNPDRDTKTADCRAQIPLFRPAEWQIPALARVCAFRSRLARVGPIVCCPDRYTFEPAQTETGSCAESARPILRAMGWLFRGAAPAGKSRPAGLSHRTCLARLAPPPFPIAGCRPLYRREIRSENRRVSDKTASSRPHIDSTRGSNVHRS